MATDIIDELRTFNKGDVPMTRSLMIHCVAALLMALVGGTGLPLPAQAMEVDQGNLMLALFSNETEYYRNLGPASTLLAGPEVNINIGSSSLNPLSVTTGSNPVQWTLLQVQGTTQVNTFMHTASTLTSQQIVDSQTNNSVVPVHANMAGWRNQLSLFTPPGTEATLLASDPASFSSNFGVGGTLNGAMLAGGFQSGFDSLLHIVKGQARVAGPPLQLNVFSDIGRAVLSANGLLSICGTPGCTPGAPVPVPAALLLFLTGLFGLAAFARRTSLNPFVS